MKKQTKKWLSLCLAVMLVLSLFTVSGVSAASGDKMFELDLSGLDVDAENGTNRGLTGKKGSAENSIELYCGGLLTWGNPLRRLQKSSFSNLAGTRTDYMSMWWDAGDGNANRRLAVSIPSAANKSVTAEYWIKYTKSSWNNFVSILPSAADEGNIQAAWAHIRGDGSNLQLRAGTSQDNAPYVCAEGAWNHVVLQRELTDNGDGKTTTTAKLYVNGVYMGSNSQTESSRTETSLTVYAGAPSTTTYCPRELSLAGLTVYEGILDATTVKAHYDAEVDTYTPATAPVIKLAGSVAGNYNPTFTLTSDWALKADSVDAGVVVKNSDGTVAASTKTLSADGKSIAIRLSDAKVGTYIISVTDSLKADRTDLSAEAADHTVTVGELDYKADWSTLGFSAGETKRVSDVAAVMPWITGESTGGAASTDSGTMTLDANNNLIYGDPYGLVASQNYNDKLMFNTGGEISYGLLEANISLKGNFSGIDSGFYIIPSATTSKKIVDYTGLTGLNKTTFLPLHLEFYAPNEASDWQVKIYNQNTGALLVNTTLARSEIGNIKKLYINNFFDISRRFSLTIENNSLSMRWSPTTAKYATIKPASGSTLYSTGSPFAIIAATDLDAAGVSGKVKLTDKNGDAVAMNPTVSGGVISFMIPKLSAGQYTLTVDEGVLTSGGVSMPALSAQYTVVDMSAEEKPSTWGFETGKAKTADDLAAKAALVNAYVPSGNGYEEGQYFVNEDGSLTFRYTPTDTNHYNSQMLINAKDKIYAGYARLDLSIDMQYVERRNYEYKLSLMGEKDGTTKAVDEVELANGSGGLYFGAPRSMRNNVDELNNTHQVFTGDSTTMLAKNPDGYAPIRFELYRADVTDDWTLTVTNMAINSVLVTDVIPADEIGNITGLRVYHFQGYDGSGDLTFKDISLLCSDVRILGKAALGDLTIVDEAEVEQIVGDRLIKNNTYAWFTTVENCTKSGRIVAAVYTADHKLVDVQWQDYTPNEEMASQNIFGTFTPGIDGAVTVKIMLLDVSTLTPLTSATVH